MARERRARVEVERAVGANGVTIAVITPRISGIAGRVPLVRCARIAGMPARMVDFRRGLRHPDRPRHQSAARHGGQPPFLRAAVEAGIELVDTAHLYADGESEATIGAALAPVPAGSSSSPTKGGYHPGEGHPDRLRAQLEQSFERLRTDRISLYYLHRVDPETPLEESLSVLEEYRDAGRIGHIGISEVSVDQVERARAVAPIAAVQNEYNLAERMWDEVVDHCASREHRVRARSIHSTGRDPLRPARSPIATARRLRQVALAWLLKRSPTMVPIPGTLSIEHAAREPRGAGARALGGGLRAANRRASAAPQGRAVDPRPKTTRFRVAT